MELRQITESYSVAPQISVADIRAIRQAGFRSVICNRPDSEHPGEAPAEDVQKAAEEAGLAFRYIPVVSGAITPQNVADQAAALEDLDGPVLAYCRSGARCTNLFAAITQAGS